MYNKLLRHKDLKGTKEQRNELIGFYVGWGLKVPLERCPAPGGCL